MIEDLRELPAGEPLRAKLCIVGAGIAGILLALELEQLGHDVLLLEAGNQRRDPEQPTRRLGGALALWDGCLLPLDSSDFAPHATRKQAWPFGMGELQSWYQLANQRLHGGAYEYLATLALPEEPPLFAQLRASSAVSEHKTWRWSAPLRFAHFRKRLQASRRVRVLYNALVSELRVDAGNTRVQSALLQVAPGHTRPVEAATFVLCAGGLETARLLLASRSARAAGLGGQSGHLGRHYLSHAAGELGALDVDPLQAARLCAFETSRDGVYCRRVLALSERARAQRSLLNLHVSFSGPDPDDPSHGCGILSASALPRRLRERSGYADTLRHLGNIVGTVPNTLRTLAGWSRQRWAARRVPALIPSGRSGRVRLRFAAEQSDDAQNQVTLSEQRDSFGMPRLHVRHAVGERDRQSYHASLSLLADELSRFRVGHLQLPTRERFLREARFEAGRHPMGLTRMSASCRDGVVDAQCRLHEVPNVYVASASVFPTSGAAPPALTLAALALRLAHQLDKQQRTRS